MNTIEIEKRYSVLADDSCCLSCGGAINYAKISKDEISALILAFRNGITVDQNNYEYIFEQIKNKFLKIEDYNTLKTYNHDKYLLDLKELIEKVLNGEITLSNAIGTLSNNKT